MRRYTLISALSIESLLGEVNKRGLELVSIVPTDSMVLHAVCVNPTTPDNDAIGDIVQLLREASDCEIKKELCRILRRVEKLMNRFQYKEPELMADLTSQWVRWRQMP